jgi:hypothetical protein
MRLKNLAAIAAVSSLLMVSSPALSAASSLSLANAERAGVQTDDESELLDSGFIGFMIVFGAGAAVGALLYSLIKGGSSETPVSP